MGVRRVNAHAGEFIEGLLKESNLLPGTFISRGTVPVVVGQMSEDAMDFKTLHFQQLFKKRLYLLWQDAEPAHAGIDFNVDLNLPAAIARTARQNER